MATTLDGSAVPMRVGTVYEQIGELFAYACLAITAFELVVRRARRVRSAQP